MNEINCFKCEFYFVTWDPKFPRGCKVFGFKTVHMPSKTVYESTGKPCENFTPKPKFT